MIPSRAETAEATGPEPLADPLDRWLARRRDGATTVEAPDEAEPIEQADWPESPWTPVDLATVLADKTVERPTLLERSDGECLFYPGRLNLILGESEAGKSWAAAITVAQQIQAGKQAWYIDFEDTPKEIAARMTSLGLTEAQVAEHLVYLQPTGRFDSAAEWEIERVLATRGTPAVVIIDASVGALREYGLNPNSSDDVDTLYSSYPRWLARRGPGVTMIDHVVKNREARGRWASGSERKISGIDGVALSMDRIKLFGRGMTGMSRLTIAKDRLGVVRGHSAAGVAGMLTLISNPDGSVSYALDAQSPQEGPFQPTGIMEAVSRELERAGTSLSKNQLETRVKGAARFVRLAVDLLEEQGYVNSERGPRGATLVAFVRPFHAEDVTNA